MGKHAIIMAAVLLALFLALDDWRTRQFNTQLLDMVDNQLDDIQENVSYLMADVSDLTVAVKPVEVKP